MSTQDAQLPSEKLSWQTKLAFGVGDLSPAIVAAIKGFYLNAFLLDVAGIEPIQAGIFFILIQVWDAVNDPLIGTLTDRTNTRWGRRRPWLLFGAIPFGVLYFLHWVVPPLGRGGKLVYYLIVAFLLDSAYTAVNVPYSALTPELTHDYDERTSLSSYRFAFSILGGVIAAFLHGVIVNAIAPEGGSSVYVAHLVSAAIWAVFIITPNFITFAFTRETHFKEDRPEGPGFWEGLRIVAQNKAFVAVAFIRLLSWLGIQFVQNNLQLYVKYWTGGESLFPVMILAIQISTFLFMLLWNKVSQRIGKKNTYYVGSVFLIVVLIVMFFVQPGQIALLFVLGVLAGGGVAISYLIPWSMVPDVIELDELETGQRREGIFYGFFVLMQKGGLALGLGLSNAILGATGYIRHVPGQPIPEQPESALLALRTFVSFAPVVILLLSFVAVYLYPITREKHAEARAELKRRQAQAQV